MIDIRSKVPPFTHSVLDATARATGEDMAVIVRDVLADWAKSEHRKAVLILRLTREQPKGGNGDNGGGNGE